MDEKSCNACHQRLFRRSNETTRDWNERQHCNAVCANRIRRHCPPKGHCRKCLTPVPKRLTFCSDACREKDREIRRAQYIEMYGTISLAEGVRRSYQKSKVRAVVYKGGTCVDCGYSRCLGALHFHHRNPSDKDFTISGHNWSWDRIRAELDKCDLVCANCHAERHEREGDAKRAIELRLRHQGSNLGHPS